MSDTAPLRFLILLSATRYSLHSAFKKSAGTRNKMILAGLDNAFFKDLAAMTYIPDKFTQEFNRSWYAVIGMLGALLFVASSFGAVLSGGVTGVVRDGRYFLQNHAVETEVSEAIWRLAHVCDWGIGSGIVAMILAAFIAAVEINFNPNSLMLGHNLKPLVITLIVLFLASFLTLIVTAFVVGQSI